MEPRHLHTMFNFFFYFFLGFFPDYNDIPNAGDNGSDSDSENDNDDDIKGKDAISEAPSPGNWFVSSVQHFEWTTKEKTNAVLVTHILKERSIYLYFDNFILTI